MKKSLAYTHVEETINKVTSQEKHILKELLNSTPGQIISMATALKDKIGELTILQNFFYIVVTVEEIKAIVNCELIDSAYNWSEDRFNRLALPKDMHCTHEQYSKDLKLQALMPNKRF